MWKEEREEDGVQIANEKSSVPVIYVSKMSNFI